MKKIISIMLMIAILFSFVGCMNENTDDAMVSSTPCDHSWKDADCVTLKTCLKCGLTTGKLKAHSNDKSGKCHYCDFVDPKIEAKLKSCTLALPKLPATTSVYKNDGTLSTTYEVTDIKYVFEDDEENVSLKLYMSGKKIYDVEGNNYKSNLLINCNIYDMDGNVVRTCSVSGVSSLANGDTFKDVEDDSFCALKPGQYELRLIRVYVSDVYYM